RRAHLVLHVLDRCARRDAAVSAVRDRRDAVERRRRSRSAAEANRRLVFTAATTRAITRFRAAGGCEEGGVGVRLLERADELAFLSELIASLRERGGGSLIEGEAGIGKTKPWHAGCRGRAASGCVSSPVGLRVPRCVPRSCVC